jgi:hypothetical protein
VCVCVRALVLLTFLSLRAHPPAPGLCLAHLGRLEEADAQLAALLAEPAGQFADLFQDVGLAFCGMGQHSRAVVFLEQLAQVGRL